MFRDALMQIPACESNVTRITTGHIQIYKQDTAVSQ